MNFKKPLEKATKNVGIKNGQDQNNCGHLRTKKTHVLCPYVVIHSIEISYCAILDLCTKSEKFAEELDLCTKSEKITNRTFASNWKIRRIPQNRFLVSILISTEIFFSKHMC